MKNTFFNEKSLFNMETILVTITLSRLTASSDNIFVVLIPVFYISYRACIMIYKRKHGNKTMYYDV